MLNFCHGIKNDGLLLEKIAKKSKNLNGKMGITFGNKDGKPVMFRRPHLNDSQQSSSAFNFSKPITIEMKKKKKTCLQSAMQSLIKKHDKGNNSSQLLKNHIHNIGKKQVIDAV